MRVPSFVTRHQPLARFTSLELGGPAAYFCQAQDPEELRQACAWAQAAGIPLHVLAGGSNVVIADGGVPGLVLRMTWQGLEIKKERDTVTLIADAGTPLDEVVALSVAEGWAGLECLSGIPGSVGAAPVQNAGAYGQEVGERILWVEAFHQQNLDLHRLAPQQCGFSYRSSIFRGQTPWIITRVAFALTPGGEASVRYGELVALFNARSGAPSLGEVRQAVLALREQKGMVWHKGAAESRTVGSFFKNPLLSPAAFQELKKRLWQRGILPHPQVPPHVPTGSEVKVPAAWLVEQAGFPKGFCREHVGISPRHALALVHLGGGSSAELVALAADIQEAVWQSFGVLLEPEPVFWGFGPQIPLQGAITL